MEKTPPASSWWARNDFLIRRLHSLTGLVPVGAYMVVHLFTNALILNSPVSFQKAVTSIHGLGRFLIVVEWLFIFLPILFHAILGVVLIRYSQPNHHTYRYTNNYRYTLQRATGMIAFVFIMWHVFHLHGWLHWDPWLNTAKELGGAQFRAYNAASTAGRAFQGSFIIPLLYAVGVLSTVFHFANGVWTMGITWGVWVTPAAQRWANAVAIGLGVLLSAVGLSSIAGMMMVDTVQAEIDEDRWYESGVANGQIIPDEHKRSAHERAANISQEPGATAVDDQERPRH